MITFSWKKIVAFAALSTTLIVGAILLSRLFAPDSTAPAPPKEAGYHDASLPVEDRVKDLLGRMTLDEKIGQMALVEKNSLKKTEDIVIYGIGAVLSGAGGKPDDNTPKGWKEMVERFTDAARGTRLGIPLLYGTDANHGNGNVPGATVFPHFIGLGAANDPGLTERIARATAEESAAMGVRWHFSPTFDLPKDIRWGRIYETFSDDPERASSIGTAYIRGLQRVSGKDDRIDVLATAKHYIGLGSMTWGTSTNNDFHIDQGVVPDDDPVAMSDAYLPPYRAALDAGAISVMAGLASWGGNDISANRYLLTDVLKKELGFRGFVVSDWYGVYAISRNDYRSLVSAVNAGIDMAMLPFDYGGFASDMREAVVNGDIPQSRIDDAVRRILRAKFAMGLFDEQGATVPGLEVVGSQEHRAIAREAVQRSLVLLKNRNKTLPISSDARLIRVAGGAADNIGRQAGGWTVEWQGIDGNWLPGATSILAGIRAAAGKQTAIEYDLRGDFQENDVADVGIAVVGEKPYAEGWGDNAQPRLDDADLAAIANLRKASRKIVVILVTGRPLIITDEIPTWDAAVAAWLPGSEGEGVADMLFGASPFTGTLPLPWPRTVEQLPMGPDGLADDGSAPLFPHGF
ncbi:MAG: glycoside hydrolase family 3 N-terminal domain-containing protein [Patescibacteria group bacterium]|jgi:beta-glucosidase